MSAQISDDQPLESAITPSPAGVRAKLDSAQLSPEGRAFARLLSGLGGPLDEAAMGVQVAGSRLIALAPGPGRRVESLAQALRAGNGPVVAVEDSVVHLLARSTARRIEDRDRLGSAHRLVAYARRIDSGLRAAISTEVGHCSELPQARQDIVELLEVHRCEEHVALAVEDYWSHLVLQRMINVFGDLLPQGSPLLALIAAAGTPTDRGARTLLRWLANARDFRRTSSELSLHVNTVRYRVARAQQHFGLDLADQRQLALAQLCALLPLSSTATGATEICCSRKAAATS